MQGRLRDPHSLHLLRCFAAVQGYKGRLIERPLQSPARLTLSASRLTNGGKVVPIL